MASRDYQHVRSWSLNQDMHRRNYSIRLPADDSDTRRRRFGRDYRLPEFRTWNRRTLGYVCLSCAAAVYLLLALRLRYFTAEKVWPAPLQFGEGQTLVYRTEDLRRVWEWEVAAGHYPTRREVPPQLGVAAALRNPVLPPGSAGPLRSSILGVGPRRSYFVRGRGREHAQVAPRPIPGSSADMDVVMKHCDFSLGKHVRDCLSMLREGAGLMNIPPRDKLGDSSYIYTENGTSVIAPTGPYVDFEDSQNAYRKSGFWGKKYEPPVHLAAFPDHRAQDSGCDPEDPRIFHVFWAGRFTDKPYMAILSFLYTQNLGLHLERGKSDPSVCSPQLWIWVNQGPPTTGSGATEADARLWQQLRTNPWTAPFLHPRFQEVVKFKTWNTADQLDAVPELKGDWRRFKNEVLPRDAHTGDSGGLEPGTGHEARAGGVHSPLAPNVDFGGAADYDMPSVKLSDLVRFVLCHRYGGMYVDIDTVFLRDWEELWGWRGAFAYRWSRLDRYNTAVLRMHRGSALGALLLRTAARNDLDFHPIRITRYLKDAHMEDLLMRLPDALFDAAWLNVEQYQRDRPAQPFFESFDDFFVTPSQTAAAPEAMGFDGFFKGAFSYHYHNRWWMPFDPERNFPDLGPEFSQGSTRGPRQPLQKMVIDLSWSAVLKRTFEAYIRGESPNMYGEWLHQ